MTTTLDRDQVTITPCACGLLVRLATRWDPRCPGCAARVPTGAVGPLTVDHCQHGRSHGGDFWSYQHSCGGWVPPLEVTVELADYGDDLDRATAVGLVRLAELVDEDKAGTRDIIRDDLAELADYAVNHLPYHNEDACSWYCPFTGDYMSPRAWLHDGVVTVWDYDPTEGGGAIIEVVRRLSQEANS